MRSLSFGRLSRLCLSACLLLHSELAFCHRSPSINPDLIPVSEEARQQKTPPPVTAKADFTAFDFRLGIIKAGETFDQALRRSGATDMSAGYVYNRVPPGWGLPAGTKILVPVPKAAPSADRRRTRDEVQVRSRTRPSMATTRTNCCSRQGSARYHLVRPGEMCSEIARIHQVSLSSLLKRNGIKNMEEAAQIRPGQRLAIPSGE